MSITSRTIDSGIIAPTTNEDAGGGRPSCDWDPHPCNQTGTHVIVDNDIDPIASLYCPRHYVLTMAGIARMLQRFPDDPPHWFGAFDE